MSNELLRECVACGQFDNVIPTPAEHLFSWGVRYFAWLRPTIICHKCLWDIQSKGQAGGVGWGWLQSKLPFPNPTIPFPK